MKSTINICIVHYNTPELTECLIHSINKFVSTNCRIYIFDNSDKFPFLYRQSNIIYLDNTKGKLINFNKFLSKYPNRFKSTEGTHQFGSAKHTISIEKCIKLIKEPFILLDSDILLKKDISELYDENYVYIGETILQPLTNNIYRILPYICFINASYMINNDLHYFNERYMHGLYYSKKSDMYDTGAGFYEECKFYNHKDIVCNDYIVHYKGGSWENTHNERIQNNISSKEWLEKFKNLWDESTYEQYKEDLLYYSKFKRKLNINLDTPKTIQDKINWLKLYDSTPLKTKCADKIKVHEYSKEVLGEDICVPIIKTYNSTDEINWDELPNNFVIKCNHGSGMNIIIRNKEDINKEEIVKQLNIWINEDFAYRNGYEMQYHNIERKIFVEKFIGGTNTDIPDYKIFCFNGIPKIIKVMNDRYLGKLRANYYDLDFNPLYYSRNDFPANYNILDKKPLNLKLMIEYAKKLSKPFKYVRVDFYEIGNKVYLGELTFTPGSGYFKYKNNETENIIGNLLDLNDKTVIYTCITNDYDKLYDIDVFTPNCDYICFTDNPHLMSRTWEIRPIPDVLNHLSPVKQQRYIKLHPHEFLSNYNFSIWVDGSIKILNDLKDIIEKNRNEILSIPMHPDRDCIYDEFKLCIEKKKDTYENMYPQIEKYQNEGYPKHNGLVQSNIIFRNHNNQKCIDLMNIWWNEIENGSHRDQISFNYALWKYNNLNINYLDKKLFNSKWFFWITAHKKKKPKTNNANKQEKPKIELNYKWTKKLKTHKNKIVETPINHNKQNLNSSKSVKTFSLPVITKVYKEQPTVKIIKKPE